MKISAIVKGSICLLGLVGAGNFLAAPAHADQAAARAAVSITRPSGLTESVSGEVLLPTGYHFGGIEASDGGTPANPADDVAAATLVVTPSYANQGTTTQSITSLSFNAGEAVVNDADPATLTAAVIDILQLPGLTIDDAAAIIKAAAGVNGLE